MRKLALAITVAAAVVFTGVVQGQSKTDPALNKLAADYQAAYNAGDAAKLASMYADDAIVMPPDEPMVKGRSAIEARLKSEMKKAKTTIKLSPSESAISGEHAHEAGTTTVTLADGTTMSEKYLTVYKKVGGAWKIAYDIWNSSGAPKPKK